MRWQTTAILAAVLIALGAFYYVYELRLGPERERGPRGIERRTAGHPAALRLVFDHVACNNDVRGGPSPAGVPSAGC